MEKKKVFHADPKKLNRNQMQLVIEQYKMYVGTLSDSSEARRTFHTLFITISSIVFAGIGIVGGNGNPLIPVDKHMLVFANAVGVLMSGIWWSTIYHYRMRSRIILGILAEIEEHLPLRLFKTEYERTRCRRTPCVRSLEVWIPWVFGVIHVILAIGILTGFFKLGVAM